MSDGRQPMKIRRSGHAVRAAMDAAEEADRKTFAQLFPVAPPPPGVPQSLKIAMDDALAPIFNYAQAGWFGYYGESVVWPGFPYLAELTQRAEYRMLSEVRAKEMTRKGFELTYDGEEDEAKDKLTKLDAVCKRFRVIERLRLAAEHDGFFGGGQIYIDVGAVGPETAKPLVIDAAKIPKGSLIGFKNIEPMWSYPGMYNATDPLANDYFEPQQWFVNGRTVHNSRLLTMISREMPDILKPAYSFRGLSLSQMAKPYVDNWLRNRQSGSDLLHSFSVIAILSDLQAALAGEDWTTIYDRVAEFNALRDNRGAFVLDKDREDIKSLAVPLAGVEELIAQSLEFLCVVSQTPKIKLLGVQPAGLDADGDEEIRVFYDTIAALQEHLFSPALDVMLKCVQLNEFGEIDPQIGFKWVPLWQLDEAAQASVRKTDADTDAVLIDAGVIAPEESRDRLRADDQSPYHGLEGPPPEPPEMEDDPEGAINGDPAKSIGETREEQRSGV